MVYGILPRLGPELTAVVGSCFLLAAILGKPELQAQGSVESKREHSIALGLLVGGGLPLLVLLGAPVFGPSIPWLAEVVTGLCVGVLVGRLLSRGRGVPPAVGALLLLGVGEALLRAPQLVSWMLAQGIPAEVWNVPAAATLLTLCLLYTSPSPRDLSTSRMPSSA